MIDSPRVRSLGDERVTEALLRVAARMFGCTVREAGEDRASYCATWTSDEFDDNFLPLIDWTTLTLDVPRAANLSLARADFDLARSHLYDPQFLEKDDLDPVLRRYLGEAPILLGHQIQVLVREGRWDPSDRSSAASFTGHVRSRSDSLLDVMRALFFLDDPDEALMIPGRYAEVHPEHRSFLDGIEPAPLRDHISLFFQEPSASRCSGCLFLDIEYRREEQRQWAKRFEIAMSHLEPEPNTANWVFGEGQGSFSLAPL